MVALDDWQGQGRISVWYDSRFYRLNLLGDGGNFYIRDLHGFDESVASATHTNALATAYFDYETLPIMDGGQWSGSGSSGPGMWPVLVSVGGALAPLVPIGLPDVRQLDPADLSVRQPLGGGGCFSLLCSETNVTGAAVDSLGRPLPWAWNLIGGAQQSSAVQSVTSNSIAYTYQGVNYRLALGPGATCRQLTDGSLQLNPDANGKLTLNLDFN